jgi:hypothetical protein
MHAFCNYVEYDLKVQDSISQKFLKRVIYKTYFPKFLYIHT